MSNQISEDNKRIAKNAMIYDKITNKLKGIQKEFAYNIKNILLNGIASSVFLSSVSLFCFFSKYKCYNIKINFLLSGTFGIYLFHQYRPFWSMVLVPAIRRNYEINSLPSFVLLCVVIILFVVVSGSAVNLFLNKILCVIIERSSVRKTFFWLDDKFGL